MRMAQQKKTYDVFNRLATITDARGVVKRILTKRLEDCC